MAKNSSKRTEKDQESSLLGAIREPEWVKEALNSPLLREVMAAALLAGAAAGAAVLTGRGSDAAKAVRTGARGALKSATDAGGVAKSFAQQAVGAVAGIAVDAAHDLVMGPSSGSEERAEAAPQSRPAQQPKRKQQRASSAGKKSAGAKRKNR